MWPAAQNDSTCRHVRAQEEVRAALWLLGGDRDESGADGAALGIDGHAAGGHGNEGRCNIETLQCTASSPVRLMPRIETFLALVLEHRKPTPLPYQQGCR